MDFSIKSYKGRVIRINPETKYVCLTDMAAASGKLLGGWTRLKGTSEYLEALSAAMQICIDDLISTVDNTSANEDRGTWAHPEVAIEFAAWCSVGFKIQVNQWILELMTTGKVEIASQQSKLPSRELATETAVAIDRIQSILSKSNPRLAQILIDCAMNDIVEFKQLSPSEFPDDRWHGLVQIADKMGIKTNQSTRVKLGQYFGRLISAGEIDVERVREERLCNGQYEPIWCYRDNEVVRATIQDWAISMGLVSQKFIGE